MANDDPPEGHTLQVAATAANAAEADLIVQRLAEAGITATSQRTIGGPEWGESGSQFIYVEAAQRDRARETLKTAEGISEAELARQSEQPLPAAQPSEQGPAPEDDQASGTD